MDVWYFIHFVTCHSDNENAFTVNVREFSHSVWPSIKYEQYEHHGHFFHSILFCFPYLYAVYNCGGFLLSIIFSCILDILICLNIYVHHYPTPLDYYFLFQNSSITSSSFLHLFYSFWTSSFYSMYLLILCILWSIIFDFALHKLI